MKTSVIVKTQLEALHCWPNVPADHPSHYLVNPHRHIFHISLRFKVSHSDRDIEFIAMKNDVDKLLISCIGKDAISGMLDLGSQSCEDVATFLLDNYGRQGCFEVTVLEDGEMGAVVELES